MGAAWRRRETNGGTIVESIEECHLYVMSWADFERLMHTKPQIAFRLVEAMGYRLTDLESRLEELAFKRLPAWQAVTKS